MASQVESHEPSEQGGVIDQLSVSVTPALATIVVAPQIPMSRGFVP
jgi:hypothetical protein